MSQLQFFWKILKWSIHLGMDIGIIVLCVQLQAHAAIILVFIVRCYGATLFEFLKGLRWLGRMIEKGIMEEIEKGK